MFLVAAELARHGWPASVTYGNTPRTDVLGAVGARQIPVAIQVKTKGERSRDFQLGGVAAGSPRGVNEWVVLVALYVAAPADFYVVPRNHVAATVLAVLEDRPGNTRGMLGPQEFEGYRDEWELMERPAEQVPWRGQGWVLRRSNASLVRPRQAPK